VRRTLAFLPVGNHSFLWPPCGIPYVSVAPLPVLLCTTCRANVPYYLLLPSGAGRDNYDDGSFAIRATRGWFWWFWWTSSSCWRAPKLSNRSRQGTLELRTLAMRTPGCRTPPPGAGQRPLLPTATCRDSAAAPVSACGNYAHSSISTYRHISPLDQVSPLTWRTGHAADALQPFRPLTTVAVSAAALRQAGGRRRTRGSLRACREHCRARGVAGGVLLLSWTFIYRCLICASNSTPHSIPSTYHTVCLLPTKHFTS